MPGKRILLVEGTDDEHVLKHLCGQRGVGRLDEIKPQGSVEPLLENFPVRLKESEIEVLGVVLDADTDVAGRWDALKHRLKQAGYGGVPDHPDASGTILVPPANTLLPRFGVWIMPDNQSKGVLEDFLSFVVPAGSRLFEHDFWSGSPCFHSRQLVKVRRPVRLGWPALARCGHSLSVPSGWRRLSSGNRSWPKQRRRMRPPDHRRAVWWPCWLEAVTRRPAARLT
jgi:hypothetical protein